jgi:hypothetical protein
VTTVTSAHATTDRHAVAAALCTAAPDPAAIDERRARASGQLDQRAVAGRCGNAAALTVTTTTVPATERSTRARAVRIPLAYLIALLTSGCGASSRWSQQAVETNASLPWTVATRTATEPVEPGPPPGTEAASATGTTFSAPTAVMAAFESAWCPFRWNEPRAARMARARVFMTPAAAARLRVPQGWWVGQVVPNRTVARCSRPLVYAPDAPSTGSLTVLRSMITRVSEDETTGRSASESVSDQRWLMDRGGRWLVDATTEGG